ncbi:MAG: hypothetical protein KAS32_15380 [Candidatus Peribacteraceae bacterium]|nr:hypothetical protein [Candidatus Peribacteraceae bacterium]
MTNNLPENWDHTEGDEVVPIRTVKPNIENITKAKKISRKPAAVVGVTIAIIAGFSFFSGLDSLRGQLDTEEASNSRENILISEAGIEPSTVYAKPGETLTWENRQEIPHYLVSETLCDVSGECMSTTTMFPLSEGTYDIPENIQPGEYTYYSPTDATLTGIILIEDEFGNVPSPQTSESPPMLSSSSSSEAPRVDDLPPSRLSIQESSTSSSSSTEVTSSSSIESKEANPLLESIRKQLEQDQKGKTVIRTNINTGMPQALPNSDIPGVPHNPYATGINQNTIPESNRPQGNLLGNTVQKPLSQPGTGTGTWIVGIFILLSIFILSAFIGKKEVLYK